jgi:hypothetical protein
MLNDEIQAAGSNTKNTRAPARRGAARRVFNSGFIRLRRIQSWSMPTSLYFMSLVTVNTNHHYMHLFVYTWFCIKETLKTQVCSELCRPPHGTKELSLDQSKSGAPQQNCEIALGTSIGIVHDKEM